MQGFSNCLGLFQAIVAKPVLLLSWTRDDEQNTIKNPS